MAPTPTRWTLTALVLILVSLMLYLFVVVAEQNQNAQVPAAQPTHVEVGNGEGQEGNVGEAPGVSNHTDETVLGFNLESPIIVTAALALWSVVALGLVWRARWALVGGMGLGALFIPGDLFELVNKAKTADAVLIAAVVVAGLMHVGIIYLCWRAMRSTSLVSPAGS